MAVNMPTNHTKTYIWAIMAGATFLSSCVAMPRAPYDFPEDETARAPLNPNYETAPVITPTQQAGAQPMYPYGGMMPMPQGYPLPALNVAQDPAVLDLKQRLDRAEQALPDTFFASGTFGCSSAGGGRFIRGRAGLYE
jgi:hypothetical protein